MTSPVVSHLEAVKASAEAAVASNQALIAAIDAFMKIFGMHRVEHEDARVEPKDVCPKCGSEHLALVDGVETGRFCMQCSKIFDVG